MTSGILIALIIYRIHPTFVTAYICLSIGGIISGYMFTTRTFKYLSFYKIIKKCYIKDQLWRDEIQKIKLPNQQQ